MQNAPTRVVSSLPGGGVPALIILLVVDSLHYVFARLLLPYISPDITAMYVMGIATAEVGVYGLATRRLRLGALRRYHWPLLAIGFLVAASTSLSYRSVEYVDAGTASLLSQTSTLFALGLGLFWLRERLTRVQIGGALLAVTGTLIITFQGSEILRLGSLMVLLAAFMYAVHAAVAKRYGGQIRFLDFFFLRLLYSTGFLFLFAAGERSLTWPNNTAWLLVVIVGTVDVVISRALYYVALRWLKMSVHSTLLTLSPLVAVGLSLLLFGTLPTPRQLLGGLAVIAGTMIVLAHRDSAEHRAGG